MEGRNRRRPSAGLPFRSGAIVANGVRRRQSCPKRFLSTAPEVFDGNHPR